MANRKPSKHVKLAKEHIEDLFRLSDKAFVENSELSDRYIDLARKTAMKYKISLNSQQKRKFCKYCYHYLMPGVNCRVRTQSGKLVYYCLSCKNFNRISLVTTSK